MLGYLCWKLRFVLARFPSVILMRISSYYFMQIFMLFQAKSGASLRFKTYYYPSLPFLTKPNILWYNMIALHNLFERKQIRIFDIPDWIFGYFDVTKLRSWIISVVKELSLGITLEFLSQSGRRVGSLGISIRNFSAARGWIYEPSCAQKVIRIVF